MKKYLLKILKNIVLQVISLFILIWLVAFAAISWPSWAPSWESVWGVFMNYFNNMRWSCPAWKTISGYDSSMNKICVTIPAWPKGDTWATWAQWVVWPKGDKWDTWPQWPAWSSSNSSLSCTTRSWPCLSWETTMSTTCTSWNAPRVDSPWHCVSTYWPSSYATSSTMCCK